MRVSQCYGKYQQWERVMSDNNVQEDFEVTKQAMKAYEAKLKREIGMVTKEDVEKAAQAAAVVAAWDEYLKLEREYEDGNKSTED